MDRVTATGDLSPSPRCHGSRAGHRDSAREGAGGLLRGGDAGFGL